MASKLIFLVAVAAMAQAASAVTYYKYSPMKEKQLISVLLLRDLETRLTYSFNETRACYRLIQEEYREALKFFKRGVSIEIPERDQFVLRDANSYRWAAQKALIKLRGIAYQVLEFEHQLTQILENNDISTSFIQYVALSEMKDIRRELNELFVEYEQYRLYFSQRPKVNNRVFVAYFRAFDYVNKIFKIDNIYWKMVQCIKSKENNF